MEREVDMLNTVESIRSNFPPGTRIKLLEMKDEQAPPSGTKGTVSHVDDIGSVHVKWDNGSSLALIVGADKYVIL